MNQEKDKLKELYSKVSKHSNYQILPHRLLSILGDHSKGIKKKYEEERLDYILKNLNIFGGKILDIGGNSGYFSFEMLENGADTVHYIEGNKVHAEFVNLSAKILNVEENINITNEYVSFSKECFKEKYDVILLLNVLHHVGDDYGEPTISIKKAKETILQQLNSLACHCDFIVFQLGFNWKGNKDLCLFKKGEKQEVIEFLEKGTLNKWEITKVGIPQKKGAHIEYCDVNKYNLNRIDALGEFLNRPIFIMKSLSS